jgi:flagellar hook-basal body complex protein FliE
MIEAVTALNAILDELQSLASAATGPSPADLISDPSKAADGAAPTFSQALHSALGRVDETIAHANANAHAFAAGNRDIPLSDVMVSLEQANLALQMASGVRDKVVSAYSNIMNMQV